MSTCVIERVAEPYREEDVDALARLLIDAVDSGAAVSFMAPLSFDRARAWWEKTLASAADGSIVLVARDEAGIAGTVQLHPSWAPNQPHRADVAKLIVHRRRRGSGLGAALMKKIEDDARQAGFRLLTLDAKRGGTADRLYRRLDWIVVGTIPKYALDSDGTPHDTVVFYKDL